MICKYCQGELPEDAKFCLHCGKLIESGESPAEEAILSAEPEAEVVIAADEAPDQEDEQTVSPEEATVGSRNLKKLKRIAAISGCLAGLAVLGTVLVVGIMGNWKIFDFLKPRENDVYYKDSYSVSDSKAENAADTIVGTMGDIRLTNGQLQMHYWMQVYDFIDQYGYYASYFGLDYTAPLDEQEVKEGMTWQQYFLEGAVQNWQTYAALSLEAKANNFQISEEYQELLDKLEEEMTKTATKDGFANVDEMIADEMGAGATFADYYDYLEQYYTGYAYFEHHYEQIKPTYEQVDAYFTENAESFASKSITKESGKYIDVRHILKHIDKYGEKAKDAAKDDPNYGYSQEAWDACLADAQAILDAWLAGEKTEDSFGKLANEKSDDQNGKVTNGGLYTGVTEGQMVEAFNDWCFDETRAAGDYGLVKTEFGYHIMYFVGGEDIWYAEAENELIAAEAQKLVEAALTAHPIEMDYKKIVLAVVDMK